jgi:hypothetical protein
MLKNYIFEQTKEYIYEMLSYYCLFIYLTYPFY